MPFSFNMVPFQRNMLIIGGGFVQLRLWRWRRSGIPNRAAKSGDVIGQVIRHQKSGCTGSEPPLAIARKFMRFLDLQAVFFISARFLRDFTGFDDIITSFAHLFQPISISIHHPLHPNEVNIKENLPPKPHFAKHRHHLDWRVNHEALLLVGVIFLKVGADGWPMVGGIRWAVCQELLVKVSHFPEGPMVVKSQLLLEVSFGWAFQMIAWCLFQDPSYWNHLKRCLVAQLAVANREKKGILGLQVPKSSFGTVPCRHFVQFSYATSSKGAIVPGHCLLMLPKGMSENEGRLKSMLYPLKSTISMDIWDIRTYPNARVKSSYGLLRQNLLNNSSATLDSPF